MFINNKLLCKPIIGASLESIYELIGAGAGNSMEISLAYLELPPGASTTRHYHPSVTEIYYVLDGCSLLILGAEERMISKGDTILIPKNYIHQIVNQTDHVLHLLTVSTPCWTPDSEVVVE